MRSHLAMLAVVALVFCASCLPSKGQRDPEIVTAIIGGREYFVPQAYLTLGGKTLPPTSIYVLAFYPDFRPAWDNHNTIWKEGKWKQGVNILAAYSPAPATIEVQLNSAIALLHATMPAGREYGLDRVTQPDGEVKDHRDIWIERTQEDGNKAASYTTCGSKKCALYLIWNDNFFVTASFHRELLPEWRSLKNHTVNLLDSFRSAATAEAHLKSTLRSIPFEEEQ